MAYLTIFFGTFILFKTKWQELLGSISNEALEFFNSSYSESVKNKKLVGLGVLGITALEFLVYIQSFFSSFPSGLGVDWVVRVAISTVLSVVGLGLVILFFSKEVLTVLKEGHLRQKIESLRVSRKAAWYGLIFVAIGSRVIFL